MIGATVDITDMKEAQHALIRSEKLAAAGRIAASIAHEINNPLNSVGNLIYLAQPHEELPLEAREWLAQANEELMRTARIAQQTLGFYKDTSEPSLLDVHALVQEVVRFYSAQAKRRRVQVDVSGGPVWVYVKAGELRQALSNILINAVDASRETSQIAITVFGDNRRATIRVRDHGPGVPETLRERIFEPFFTTKKDVGTGLGLWTTRQLLRAAGGDVELAKTDDGAEFVLWLPRSQELDASAD